MSTLERVTKTLGGKRMTINSIACAAGIPVREVRALVNAGKLVEVGDRLVKPWNSARVAVVCLKKHEAFHRARAPKPSRVVP